MEIINKSENWWLRLAIVLITLVWLSSLSVMNREVITERTKLTDSLNYYKLQNDSLTDETFNLNVELGRHELTREEMFFKYKGLEKDYNNYLEHETE